MRIRLVLTLLLALSGSARADEWNLHLGGWYFKPGVQLGAVLMRDRGAGFAIGPAVGMVHLSDRADTWYGLRADLLADTNGDADLGARWSIRPELGTGLFGAEVGYLGERVGGRTYGGLTGRAKVTIGFAGAFLGVAHVFDSPDGTSVELGVYVGFPIQVTHETAER